MSMRRIKRTLVLRLTVNDATSLSCNNVNKYSDICNTIDYKLFNGSTKQGKLNKDNNEPTEITSTHCGGRHLLSGRQLTSLRKLIIDISVI